MSFSDFKEPSSPLFKEWKMLKIKAIVEIENFLFSYSFLNGIYLNPLIIFFLDVVTFTPIQKDSADLSVYTFLDSKVWNTI